MNLIPRSSPGSFCAEILIINAITGQSLTPRNEELTPPKRSLGVGGCHFAIDPNLPPHRTSLVWLPHLDSSVVLIAPAPQDFGHASAVRVAPAFQRRGTGGGYLILNDRHGRVPVVLIDGANVATPAAAVIPLDSDFVVRADAALRLWRLATGRAHRRPPDRLTPQRRQRLALTLRVLDGRLAGETYRTIAQAIFGATRVPTGAGWKTHDLRDRTIRLARAGVKLMRGGYLDLLRFPGRQHE